MKKYEVGQRIDIYKVMPTQPYYGNDVIPGTFRAGFTDKRSPKLIHVIRNLSGNTKTLGLFQGDSCRKVGTMIITKLK